MSFVLTDEQENGIQKAKEWFLSETTKPFVFVGCAGSGKSTVVKFIIENLGLPDNAVRYVSFTGKAASVLIKKGNPATTIHKLIYDPVFDDKGKIKEFVKKEEIDSNIKLIVVDECYMISDEIMKDLLSFNVKTICLGDDAQLPPPFGELSNLFNNPDAKLTKPLRQALDNPIVYLADLARTHQRIKTGDYGNDVIVVRKNDMPLDRLQNADQIIAGKNETVKKMNKFYRSNFLGIKPDEWIPRKNEKLICLKNNWNLSCNEDGLTTNMVNGLGLINETKTEDVVFNPFFESLMMDVRPDFYNDHVFKSVLIDSLYLKHGFTREDELFDKKNIGKFKYGDVLKKRINTSIEKATYGYCITTHKSQGSEWEDVFFIFEPFRGPREKIYWQMLYTGITRASEKLVVVI